MIPHKEENLNNTCCQTEKPALPTHWRPQGFEFHPTNNNPYFYDNCNNLITQWGERIILSRQGNDSITVNRNGVFIGNFQDRTALTYFLNAMRVHPY